MVIGLGIFETAVLFIIHASVVLSFMFFSFLSIFLIILCSYRFCIVLFIIRFGWNDHPI